jgi:hypothetical protein
MLVSVAAAGGYLRGDGRIGLRPVKMGSDVDILRLAVGVFYDIDRLINALKDIFSLGLTHDDVWVAGQKQLFDAGSPLQQGLIGAGGGLATLADRIGAAGELPDASPLWGTGGPLQNLFLTARTQKDANGAGRFFIGGRIGRVLQDHAGKGAIIATARAQGPSIQDQCVRVLLRYSLHTVHSMEYRQPPSD